jgi:hypothetical protein
VKFSLKGGVFDPASNKRGAVKAVPPAEGSAWARTNREGVIKNSPKDARESKKEPDGMPTEPPGRYMGTGKHYPTKILAVCIHSLDCFSRINDKICKKRLYPSFLSFSDITIMLVVAFGTRGFLNSTNPAGFKRGLQQNGS